MSELSKTLIDDINPTGQEVALWDSSLQAKASGAKTFVIQYRNRHGPKRRT
jgi:hypothetical protein